MNLSIINTTNQPKSSHHKEIGKVMHECESELVCKLSHPDNKIPYFNAGIYLENKKKIGKIDEIFGPLNLVMFTIKMDPGIVAKSFQEKDSVYIGTDKLLPLSRFTNPGGGELIFFCRVCFVLTSIMEVQK
jgi:H/ACA ribonucleoprotein complex subunit 1